MTRMHEIVQRAVAARQVPGVVAAVARGDRVDIATAGSMAFGGAPMRRDTLFRITSMTKPMTAAAILALVDEGVLKLDDMPDMDAWRPVMISRPTPGITSADARAAAEGFAAGLQAGYDERDADILNQQFAADVMWGSPYGALIEGYDQLHPIHTRFQREAGERPAVRYEVRHALAVSEAVVIAHIARLILGPDGTPAGPTADSTQPFSETA